MIQEDSVRFLLSKKGNMLPLCTAAFLQSSASGVWAVAIPYIVKRFDGTDTQLGLCVSLWFISYLIGCLSFGGFLHRFNPRSVVQVGAGMNVLAAGTLLSVVNLAGRGACPFSPISTLIFLSAVSGIFTSLFWPPVMGWVSTGHEGAVLNKRLGLFNMSWSLGSLATPYFAGLMVEYNSTLPIAAHFTFMVLSLLAICFAKNPDPAVKVGAAAVSLPDDTIASLLPKFRLMSRVALLCAFVCVGLVRTQLAVFFKFELMHSESDYGIAMLGMSIMIFTIFTLAGHTHSWHYKLWIFAAAQVLLAASLLIILNTPSLPLLVAAVAMVGVGNSFIYTSHIYYGVSGCKNRSGRMAIHETILALGIACGGLFGGIISDKFTKYSPYKFGIAVIVAGLCIQAAIWLCYRRKQDCGSDTAVRNCVGDLAV